MSRRMPVAASLVLLATLALAACATPAPAYDEPVPTPDQPAAGTTLACEEAYPSALGEPDISAATILPADWPEGPPGSTLCSAYQTSDVSAVVQYLTNLTPDEVLAYYEPLLAKYSPVISDGIGDAPILNGSEGEFEFAIQTDPERGGYLLAAALVE